MLISFSTASLVDQNTESTEQSNAPLESIPDEDPIDEMVMDANVLAEVTFPMRAGMLSFIKTVVTLILSQYSVQMVR